MYGFSKGTCVEGAFMTLTKVNCIEHKPQARFEGDTLRNADACTPPTFGVRQVRTCTISLCAQSPFTLDGSLEFLVSTMIGRAASWTLACCLLGSKWSGAK